MALSCIISEKKRDIGRKSWFCHTPLAFDAPVRGSPSEYCHPIWCGKTRMVGLPDGENTLRICLDRISACDRRTNSQTDRRTSWHGIVRAMHTRRAVKKSMTDNGWTIWQHRLVMCIRLRYSIQAYICVQSQYRKQMGSYNLLEILNKMLLVYYFRLNKIISKLFWNLRTTST